MNRVASEFKRARRPVDEAGATEVAGAGDSAALVITTHAHTRTRTIDIMADEWLSSLALAAALSTHSRIGKDSMLGRLDTELLRMIVDKVNEVGV